MSFDRYCSEPLEFNHETLYCGELKHEEDKPHSNITGCWPPCKECFGIDLHSKECKSRETGRAYPAVKITWFSGQKPKISMERV